MPGEIKQSSFDIGVAATVAPAEGGLMMLM
jgi:hypothetical protein